MTAGGAPLVNLYGITTGVNIHDNSSASVPFQDSTGRTSVSGSISTKTAVIIFAGQSNNANVVTSAYTPTNSTVHQLNIFDGLCYTAADPLLGTPGTNGNWGGILGDRLINAGTFARVILVPNAISGTSIADHAPTGSINQYERLAYLRVRQQGWDVNTNVSTMVVWCQGETDNTLGTSQASYQASWAQVKNTYDGLGFTGKYFVAKQSYISGATNSNVQSAQAAVVDSVRVFAGPNADSLVGSNRIADSTHWSNTGASAVASLTQAVISVQYT